MTFLQPLESQFPTSVLAVYEQFGMPTVILRKDSILDVLTFLYSHADFEFQFLTDVCGIHYPNVSELPEELQAVSLQYPDIFDQEQGVLGVVYHLHNLYKNTRLRIKVFAPAHQADVPSVSSLFSSANWMERETYDFFGIAFKNHPNLTRILNMDEMTYFPLRKEYALEDATRDDKTDAFFGRTQGNV